jgi:hypothetical protein
MCVIFAIASTLDADLLLVESPAKKWPGVFSNIKLFVDYPYLLPTLVAASVTATGNLNISACHQHR